MTKDTGTKQLGASRDKHGPLDDHDCRTIPICFARMQQTARAPCRTFFPIPVLWNVPTYPEPSRCPVGAGAWRPYTQHYRCGVRQGKSMNQCDDHPFLHPTRSEISLEIRVYLITLLNQTLAYTVDLRSHVKQAAWNVKGKEFSQLHDLFAIIATELDAYTDLLAERIAVLGGVARGGCRRCGHRGGLHRHRAWGREAALGLGGVSPGLSGVSRSTAYRQVQEIQGKADAAATRIYTAGHLVVIPNSTPSCAPWKFTERRRIRTPC
jgi:Ferritin-like domain